MKNLHINDSYKIWLTSTMRRMLEIQSKEDYGSDNLTDLLNRSYLSMYIEWWLHNIGYYLTKPFCCVDVIHKTNLRFKDVDLEEWT